ncbi:MAG TPA: DUF5995 family protein, partial [Candidatus Dormibacteraeota bacterium]|nr:DUF5995 family protein [Candidatus Dormibacteraeota bacterium]
RVAASVHRWCADRDRRVHFGDAHAMAFDGAISLARGGRYLDSAWVLDLLEEWAEYYLVTIEPTDDDLSLVTPPAWAEAHGAALAPMTEAAEALMLGVNAHLNNDLPQALAYALRNEWPLTASRLERRRADFDKLLAVLLDTVDSLQCLVARFDEVLVPQRRGLSTVFATSWDVTRLSRSWREGIWQDALTLVTAVDERWSAAIREEIECTAVRRAHLLMCPIERRDELIVMPSRELDRAFPHLHTAIQCRLSGAPPVWGGSVPAPAL